MTADLATLAEADELARWNAVRADALAVTDPYIARQIEANRRPRTAWVEEL